MSDIESIKYGEYLIEAHAIPVGHMWSAEYTVRRNGTTRIGWKRANIVEGLPTHGTAIHAAFECARSDIDMGAFDDADTD